MIFVLLILTEIVTHCKLYIFTCNTLNLILTFSILNTLYRGVSKWVSSGNILKGHNLEKIKKVSTWLKDVQKIVDFYNKRDTSELFEALEIFTGKWVEGVEKFTKSDKKDKYLNGYKVDENASPLLYPQLNIVKENTTDPYDIYKKNTTLTLNLR